MRLVGEADVRGCGVPLQVAAVDVHLALGSWASLRQSVSPKPTSAKTQLINSDRDSHAQLQRELKRLERAMTTEF